MTTLARSIGAMLEHASGHGFAEGNQESTPRFDPPELTVTPEWMASWEKRWPKVQAFDSKKPARVSDTQWDDFCTELERLLGESYVDAEIRQTKSGAIVATGTVGQGSVLNTERQNQRCTFEFPSGDYWLEPIAAAESTSSAGLSLHISEILAERSEVSWVPGMEDCVERRTIVVAAGPHNTYKTFFAVLLAVKAALRGVPIMMLYGEGQGLDRRLEGALRELAPDAEAASLPVRAIRKRINLTTDKGLELLRTELRSQNWRGGVIVIDTYSKFAAGLDQNDNTATSSFVSRLDLLRTEFDCSIFLICHTGHSDKSRARGASSLIDDTDTELVFSHDKSSDVVSITRERFKDSPSLPPLNYTPRVVDLGRADSTGKPVTAVVLDACEPTAGRASGKLGEWESAILNHMRNEAGGEAGADSADVLDALCDVIPRTSAKRDVRRQSFDRALKTLAKKGLVETVKGSGGQQIKLRVCAAPAESDFLE